jgi:hypothetical protein
MIDIRKEPAVTECINAVLTAGHNVLIKREKDTIVVVGIEEQRKVVGKFDPRKMRA